AWHALQAFVERAVEHGGDVGTRAPALTHRNVGFAAAVGDVELLLRQQAVRQHRDECLAAVLRGNAQLGGFARFIAGAVQRHIEDLGALAFIRGGVPASIESRVGEWTARIGRGDLEFVASVVDAGLDLRQRAVGRCIEGAVGDLARERYGLVVPLAVATVPLPVGVEAVEHPVEPVGGDALALLVEHDDLERRRLLLIEISTLEQGLYADASLLQVDRDGEAALDVAAAGFTQAQDNAGFERLGRLRNGRQRNGNLGDAFRVSGGRRVERLLDRPRPFL